MTADRLDVLKALIRAVPDFPKPGILFRDITPMLSSPKAVDLCLELLEERYGESTFDAVVGIESRGFIFGTALAVRMRKPMVLVRKPGKLPAQTFRVDYDLEYGTDALEMHTDALEPGQRALVVDDLLATGGTARAAIDLIRRLGAEPIGAAFVIELEALGGRSRLAPVATQSLLVY